MYKGIQKEGSSPLCMGLLWVNNRGDIEVNQWGRGNVGEPHLTAREGLRPEAEGEGLP
jgi:hypothetical protein